MFVILLMGLVFTDAVAAYFGATHATIHVQLTVSLVSVSKIQDDV
jgi:hypothetical protein